jgi:hypothetical protein
MPPMIAASAIRFLPSRSFSPTRRPRSRSPSRLAFIALSAYLPDLSATSPARSPVPIVKSLYRRRAPQFPQVFDHFASFYSEFCCNWVKFRLIVSSTEYVLLRRRKAQPVAAPPTTTENSTPKLSLERVPAPNIHRAFKRTPKALAQWFPTTFKERCDFDE